jgi:hypothetical protein
VPPQETWNREAWSLSSTTWSPEYRLEADGLGTCDRVVAEMVTLALAGGGTGALAL